MGRKASLIVCCVLMALCAVAQNGRSASGEEATLIALEKMWNQAQLMRDATALQRMISDRFVSTEWDGMVYPRERFLGEISDPTFVPSLMNVQDLKVEFYGDTAVVIGIYHTKGQSKGKPYDHVGRFTDTWVKQNAVWKCVASHTSLIQK